MEIKKAYAIYFSPTGTTKKAVVSLAEGLGCPVEKVDLTLPKTRQAFGHSFDKDEVVVVGFPVYRGRLPKYLDDFFACLKGNKTSAVALAMYGNRNYDDALIELKLRLEERGFIVKAGAAFIGEHTRSKNIATGRPDKNDLAIAGSFGQQAAALISDDISGTLSLKGHYPFVMEAFDPANPGSLPRPSIVTTDLCRKCGLCAEHCPWGAIDADDPAIINPAKCMTCFRCLKNCPNSAKQITTDEKYLAFVSQLEKMLNARRCEPELFLMQ